MIRRPPRSTLDRSSAASDVYKRQVNGPIWKVMSAEFTKTPITLAMLFAPRLYAPNAPAAMRPYLTSISNFITCMVVVLINLLINRYNKAENMAPNIGPYTQELIKTDRME